MGRQFPKVQVTRKSGGLIGGPTTDYTAYTDLEQSDRGDVFGMRAAHLQVHHGDDVTQIQYPQHQAEEIYGYGGRRSKEHPMGSNVYRSHTHQDPHESGRLFNLEHTQGNDVVYSLFSTKEGRIHAPTLLGVAANDSRMRGRELQPPDDLSEHSSRMVQHFQRKGVVPASAPTAVTNEHEFVKSEYQRPEALYVWGATDITPHEHKAGRNLVRSVLRGKQTTRYVDQIEQPHLPGMEPPQRSRSQWLSDWGARQVRH